MSQAQPKPAPNRASLVDAHRRGPFCDRHLDHALPAARPHCPVGSAGISRYLSCHPLFQRDDHPAGAGRAVHLGDGRGAQPVSGSPWLRGTRRGAGRTFRLPGWIWRAGGRRAHQSLRAHRRLGKRYGQWAVMVLAFIPNPFFDVAGMAAGMLKMPVWKFLLFCWIGSTGKMFLFAYFGATIKGIFNL